MIVREEYPGDRAGVRALNADAFGRHAEADLVDALRAQAHPIVSLVAEVDGEIGGHILYSPVTLDGHPDLRLMGLGPMAVALAHRRKGIGTAPCAPACSDAGSSASAPSSCWATRGTTLASASSRRRVSASAASSTHQSRCSC